MLDNILDDPQFGSLMGAHAQACLRYFLQSGEEFCVLANVALVSFEPPLPSEIADDFKMPAIMFVLAGYTLETASLGVDGLSFEAGFGADNFASVVHIPYCAVVQLIVNDSPLFINFARPIIKDAASEIEQSKNMFLNNPKNREFLGK